MNVSEYSNILSFRLKVVVVAPPQLKVLSHAVNHTL